jgi:hypothetical protein
MYNRLDNEIIFNKNIVYDTPEVEAIVTLVHESRHAYQWDRINHPKKAIEPKELLETWKKDFEHFSVLDRKQTEDQSLNLSIEIDAIAYTHITMIALVGEKTVIPEVIKEAVEARIAVIETTELPLYAANLGKTS